MGHAAMTSAALASAPHSHAASASRRLGSKDWRLKEVEVGTKKNTSCSWIPKPRISGRGSIIEQWEDRSDRGAELWHLHSCRVNGAAELWHSH